MKTAGVRVTKDQIIKQLSDEVGQLRIANVKLTASSNLYKEFCTKLENEAQELHSYIGGLKYHLSIRSGATLEQVSEALNHKNSATTKLEFREDYKPIKWDKFIYPSTLEIVYRNVAPINEL